MKIPNVSVRSMFITLLLWGSAHDTSRAQTSFSGQFRLSSELSAAPSSDPREERTRVYKVRDENGRIVTRILRAIPYDIPAPIPAVLDDGRVMLIHSYDAMAEIFDRSGGLQKRVALQDPPKPDYERIIKVAPLRESLFLGISEGDGAAVEVLSVSGAGEVIHTARFPNARLTGIAVDAARGLTTVGTETWEGSSLRKASWFVPPTGVAWSVKAGWSEGEFSRDGSGRFIGWSSSGVHVIDIASRTVAWSTTPLADELLLGAAFDGAGAIVLSAKRPAFDEGKWKYAGAILKRIAPDGSVLSVLSVAPGTFLKAVIQGRPGSRYVEVDGVIVR